jgi:hypothetical protein
MVGVKTMARLDNFGVAAYQWGAFVLVGILGGVGAVYYLFALHGRAVTVLAEHRAGNAPAGIRAVGEEA